MDHCFLTLIYGGGPLCKIQRLKATCDEPLLTFAFNFNMRRYTKGTNNVPLLLTIAQAVVAGAHTRPLFSSTSADSDTKYPLNTP